jgi:hypothetical protein
MDVPTSSLTSALNGQIPLDSPTVFTISTTPLKLQESFQSSEPQIYLSKSPISFLKPLMMFGYKVQLTDIGQETHLLPPSQPEPLIPRRTPPETSKDSHAFKPPTQKTTERLLSAHGHLPLIPLDKLTTRSDAYHLSESQHWLEEEYMEPPPQLPLQLSLLSTEILPLVPSRPDSSMHSEPPKDTLLPLPFKQDELSGF